MCEISNFKVQRFQSWYFPDKPYSPRDSCFEIGVTYLNGCACQKACYKAVHCIYMYQIIKHSRLLRPHCKPHVPEKRK